MKKISLIIVLFFIANFVMAQTTTFGVKAGVNFASFSTSGSNALLGLSASDLASSNTTSFHVGIVADVNFGALSFQPGLLYSGKGGNDVTVNYVEVPLNLLYNIKLPQENTIFFGGGPYLGWGVRISDGETFGSANDQISNPDYGLNFTAGVRLKAHYLISANYGLGLTNLYNKGITGGDISEKNKVFGISIGYFFK